MSPATTTRRADEDEVDLDLEAEALAAGDDDDEAPAAMPAVSDRRRRRQAKQGVVIEAVPAAPAKKDRPTPSQREEAAPSGNFIVRFVNNVREYWRETRAELAKVAWPTREEVQRLTGIVIAVTIVASLFLGLISFLFSLMTTALVDANTEGLALIGAVVLVIITTGVWLFRERLFSGGE
jgi:preprotein translocase subunit SecE